MADTKKSDSAAPTAPKTSSDPVVANRETVESIVVAVILALLFRAFIAEAFVIPTGSMAPTLMGRHVDVWCDECQYHYQSSGSAERTKEDKRTGLKISNTRCPNCGYWKELDIDNFFSNEHSFSGDRIIVSKFAYELGDPKRWDIIVFKYPEGAQQNFIKRLIGLPNETIRIHGGNIYAKGKDDSEFHIARKDDSKLLALLQLVHDSDYPAPWLKKANWPAWWQPHGDQAAWKSDDEGKTYAVESADESWLRYHHVFPEPDWETLNGDNDISDPQKQNRPIDPSWRGGLIADFYAYNCEQLINLESYEPRPSFGREQSPSFGQCWVDDLALECQVEVAEATGEVLLDITRAGAHHTCRIDVTTGAATLQIRDAEGNTVPLRDGDRQEDSATAQTSLKGPGTYRLRLSNVDHELRLWVNGWRVKFDGPTAYASDELVYPDVDSADGDLAPVGIGARNQALTVRHLRVLRDKYYIADDSEYDRVPYALDDRRSPQQEIVHIFANPTMEALRPLLESRRERKVELKDNQFMPLGDNSPASSDARYWREPFVERHLLVGKANFIYWPHSWNWPPLLPNFRRMQPIR